MRSSWGASPVPRRTRVPRCTSSLSSPAIELLDDQRHRGVWVDRTALFAAKNRNQEVSEVDFTSPEDLELAPLPAWAHLSAAQRHQLMVEIIEDIERETLESSSARGHSTRRRRGGTAESASRTSRIGSLNQYRPRFHAVSEAVRTMIIGGLSRICPALSGSGCPAQGR